MALLNLELEDSLTPYVEGSDIEFHAAVDH